MRRIANKPSEQAEQSIISAIEFYLKNSSRKQKESNARQAKIVARETEVILAKKLAHKVREKN